MLAFAPPYPASTRTHRGIPGAAKARGCERKTKPPPPVSYFDESVCYCNAICVMPLSTQAHSPSHRIGEPGTFVSRPCPTTARGGCKSTSYEHSCFPVKGKLTTELMTPPALPPPHLVSHLPTIWSMIPHSCTSIIASGVPITPRRRRSSGCASHWTGAGVICENRPGKEGQATLRTTLVFRGRLEAGGEGTSRERGGHEGIAVCGGSSASYPPLHVPPPLLHVLPFCSPTDASPRGAHAP